MKVWVVIDERWPFNLDVDMNIFSSKESAETFIRETFTLKHDYKLLEREVIE